jgi:hypothetical protein
MKHQPGIKETRKVCAAINSFKTVFLKNVEIVLGGNQNEIEHALLGLSKV